MAGAFYPAHPRRLATLVDELLGRDVPRRTAAAVLVPHAGYVYSGAAAGATLGRVALPASVILLGPNHTGRGVPLAAAAEDAWLTPAGKAAVDRDLLAEIAAEDPDVRFDRDAHAAEHSLEVQVPLLLGLRGDVRIAPIVVGTRHLPALLALGAALARVIRRVEARGGERPLLLVSSDMSHYLPAEVAARRDRAALDRLAAVDPEGLHHVVERDDISMCGAMPAVAALAALRDLGAVRGEEVVYTHSGVVTGDAREVVAYAGMVFAA